MAGFKPPLGGPGLLGKSKKEQLLSVLTVSCSDGFSPCWVVVWAAEVSNIQS